MFRRAALSLAALGLIATPVLVQAQDSDGRHSPSTLSGLAIAGIVIAIVGATLIGISNSNDDEQPVSP